MDRDEFVTRFKAKLDEWNADIDELENRAQDMGTRAREESRELLSDIRGRRDAISRDFRGLGQSIGEAWHDVREGLDEAGKDLGAAIADARKRFRHDETE